MLSVDMPRAKTPTQLSAVRSGAAPPSAESGGPNIPRFGLVCVTVGPEVRYRTITRTRVLAFAEKERRATLESIYRDNLRTLFAAVDYCQEHGIPLYRCTSNLFPQIDHPTGAAIRESIAAEMAPFGAYARQKGVRVVLHPDQFVVLNSESPQVRLQSLAIMQDHARNFDLLDLPQSTWSTFILHGGKSGRAEAMIEAIRGLPSNVRSRLALENDERCYGAQQILDVCRAAGVPMIFDAHHHLVREKLDSYEHPSIVRYLELARQTWSDPDWQIVHISNGVQNLTDPRHSDLIAEFPDVFRSAPWVEVEAKGKEQAMNALRARLSVATPHLP